MGNAPSQQDVETVERLYTFLAADVAFARVQRLMEIDWSAEADITVEDVGLARLLRTQAARLRGLVGDDRDRWNALAQTIRYTERRDDLARTALWWLGHLARDPLLRHGKAR
jgi:hypothetical protein